MKILHFKVNVMIRRLTWLMMTGVATRINKIVSGAHLTYCHGHTLYLALEDAIKTIKIMRDTLGAAFELNKLIKYSVLKIIEKKVKYSIERGVAFNGRQKTLFQKSVVAQHNT